MAFRHFAVDLVGQRALTVVRRVYLNNVPDTATVGAMMQYAEAWARVWDEPRDTPLLALEPVEIKLVTNGGTPTDTPREAPRMAADGFGGIPVRQTHPKPL